MQLERLRGEAPVRASHKGTIWLLSGQILMGAGLDAHAVTLDPIHISGDVYCVSGQGGNTAVLTSGGGILIVDCKYESVADELLGVIRSISAKPITCVINTHYHADHTGGNRAIVGDAEIIMHPNCKATLSDLFRLAQIDRSYLERVTVWTEGMTLTRGGESVRLLHFGRGHTSGDIVVVFETSKVVHTGDLLFNGRPPFIDIDDDPDTKNWLRTIELLGATYQDYRFIPGHGEAADASVLADFAGYLRALRGHAAAALRQGRTKEEAVGTFDMAENPLFRDPMENRIERIRRNVECVYDELSLGRRE
jgi:glyoxylase-like metal-dependent hydrolase (beta-lactamase superfamily II)